MGHRAGKRMEVPTSPERIECSFSFIDRTTTLLRDNMRWRYRIRRRVSGRLEGRAEGEGLPHGRSNPEQNSVVFPLSFE